MFYKTEDALGHVVYGMAKEVPAGAKAMREEDWRAEREELQRAAQMDIAGVIASAAPVSLFAARKVLRDTKAADGKSYMEKIKTAFKAGKVSDDAMDALEMLDPVSRTSPWVAEIQALFELSDADVDGLFQAMRAVRT
jgi:hypothetical protein